MADCIMIRLTDTEFEAIPARRRLLAAVLTCLISLILPSCSTRVPVAHGVPSSAREAYAEGIEALRRSDVEQARASFHRAVEVGPFFVDAHRQLQNLRIAEFDREALVRDYRRLLDEHPDSAAFHYLHGRLLHRHADQIDQFEVAARLDPELVWPHYGLAVLAEQDGRRADAMQHVDRALRADRAHGPSLLVKGRLLRAEGKQKESEVFLRLAAARDPGATEPWVWLANAAASVGRRFDEIRCIEEALARDPTYVPALSRLLSLVRLGGARSGAETAFALLESTARRAPDDPTVQAILARAYESTGLGLSAWRAAEKALRLGSTDQDLVFIGRRALSGAGRPAEAFRFWAEIGRVDLENARYEIRQLGSVAQSLQDRLTDHSATLEDLADLASAMDRAGWSEEAASIARDVLVRVGAVAQSSDETTVRMQKIVDHARLLGMMRLLAESAVLDAAAQRTPSLPSFIDDVAELVTSVTGTPITHRDEILEFPFLGSILDSSAAPEGSLVEYFARHGQALLAGQLRSDPPMLMVFALTAPPKEVTPSGWNASFVPIELVGDNALVRPIEESSREVGGRALYRFYYLDMDVLCPWVRSIEVNAAAIPPDARARLLASRGLEASTSAERRSTALPLNMDETLLARTLELHGHLPLVENVRIHEQGHLFDALEFLPFWDHFFANLGMALQHAFSANGIMSALEESAERHALIHGASPHLVLAELVRALPQIDDAGPHSIGYARLLAKFVAEMDRRLDTLPNISRDHVLMHQLHFLTVEQVRSIASAL